MILLPLARDLPGDSPEIAVSLMNFAHAILIYLIWLLFISKKTKGEKEAKKYIKTYSSQPVW